MFLASHGVGEKPTNQSTMILIDEFMFFFKFFLCAMICSMIGHDTVSNPKILHNYVHDFPSLIVSVHMFIFSHPWNY